VFGIANGNGTPTNDYGADLLGGLWLFRQQMQPIVDVGWSRVFWSGQRYSVDTFRVGGKIAGGEAITDDL
jgi:hypothetical protein